MTHLEIKRNFSGYGQHKVELCVDGQVVSSRILLDYQVDKLEDDDEKKEALARQSLIDNMLK